VSACGERPLTPDNRALATPGHNQQDNMNRADIQQCVSGFNTVEVLGGPFTVRVHEARDTCLVHTPHRYFISVDFWFKPTDALRIGTPGWLGCTKAEAGREARTLAAQIANRVSALKAAETLAGQADTPTNRFTVARQKAALDRITGRYTAKFE
jgi:hypothetical protein